MSGETNKQFENIKKINIEKQENYFTLGSKIQPHSTEAEIAVLGAMIMNQHSISKTLNIIKPEMFYHIKHSIIYTAILNLFDKSITVDLPTLKSELEKMGKHEVIGGNQYLIEIHRKTPSFANVEQHCLIILDKYLKRAMIQIAAETLEKGFDDTFNVIDLFDETERKIFELSQKRFSKNYITMQELAAQTMNYITLIAEKRGSAGISTGFTKLDEMLGGFQNSDLIVIAARPSMGKTALGLSVLLNVAVNQKIPTAFFSVEMAAQQIAIRLISADSRVDQQNIRTGKISIQDNSKIVASLGRLRDSPIIIDDTAMLNVNEFKAKSRQLKAQHNIKLIIVDYLQMMHASGTESREREIAIISSTLKQVAKDLEIPVIALAQLNRSVEGRKDKNFRPMLQDLRESGAIEQDADVIMFVNRPSRYGVLEFEDGSPTAGMGELIIGKQRNGPIGTVRVVFNENIARFENYTLAVADQPQSVRDNYGAELASLNTNIDDDSPF
jgi:replicative DNA helicase